ncbi:MAG: response regulator [Nitrospirae bacterium]|nr:response regulator [Candidatus Manganitrophaceae bacterium]
MPKRVLVVDDNQDAIHILSAVLKKGGYLVSVALNGEEAMEKVRQEHPALILLDIMMPKMDGFEVCKAIKAAVETREIPVLIVTARKDAESRQRGMSVGANEYLVKPIRPAEVLAKVRAYLGGGDSSAPPSSLKSIFFSFFLLRQTVDFELKTFAYCSATEDKPVS